MKDFDRLISRFRQFGGLQLFWEYAKLGVLGIAFKEFFRCIIKRRSFKAIYPKILVKIEPVLLNKYLKPVDKVDKVYKVSKVECEAKSRIWWCWLQGLDNAPELAKSCLESLTQLNTEIVIIDDNNYTEWVELPEHIVDKYKIGKMPEALFSDMLRLALLIKYGGVWIDSTVLYTHKEGNDNVEKKFCPSWNKICSAELFMFRYTRLGEEWNGSIGNWFISARPNNPLLIELYEALCRYWKENDVTLDYYIFHLFFAELSKRYPDMISNMPYGFASACLHLRNNLGKRYSEEIWIKICSLSNFHKMGCRLRKDVVANKVNNYNHIITKYKKRFMMVKAFGVFFEFNPEEYDRKIQSLVAEKQKGYSCVVDMNVLTIAHHDSIYREIVNNATLNTCDGSSIAAFAGKIHKKDYKVYNGPEIFEKYIQLGYKHVIIGNTKEKVGKLKDMLVEKGYKCDVTHIEVPFLPVEEFDYESIAMQINDIEPDLIWVSLGAPKQEKFIHNIFPYIKRGVLFGIGAAVNFYIGEVENSKTNIKGIRLIWLQRIFKEPKKQIRRCWGYVKILPSLLWKEQKLVKAGMIENK